MSVAIDDVDVVAKLDVVYILDVLVVEVLLVERF